MNARYSWFVLLVILFGCDDDELRGDAAVGSRDASSGTCPTKITIDGNRTDTRLNATLNPPEPTFGGKGFAMEVSDAQSQNWDGAMIAERLRVGVEQDDFLSHLNQVDFCPFRPHGDLTGCSGARESVFEVGTPGDPANVQIGLNNIFWDSHFAHNPMRDTLGAWNAANPTDTISICRQACLQTYHCHTREGNQVGGEFGIAVDFTHVTPAMGPSRTDVTISKVDSTGGVF